MDRCHSSCISNPWGLVTTYLALNNVSDGNGVIAGLREIYNSAPEKFSMILEPSNPEYKNLSLYGGL